MNFMVRTSFPYHKINEVEGVFDKTEARPHSVHTQGMYFRSDLNHGWEYYTIYEVDEGKETEFSQWIQNVLVQFLHTEGFSTQIDIVQKSRRPISRG